MDSRRKLEMEGDSRFNSFAEASRQRREQHKLLSTHFSQSQNLNRQTSSIKMCPMRIAKQFTKIKPVHARINLLNLNPANLMKHKLNLGRKKKD